MTIEEYLNKYHFSKFFREHFLYPIAGSIWSGSFKDIGKFPALMLLEFLNGHKLLELPGKQPTWRTVKNGSQTYVHKLESYLKAKGVDFYNGVKVCSVERSLGKPKVIFDDESYEFDVVVIATHADTALKILQNSSEEEYKLLGEFVYEKNKVVLHSDTSHMPKHRKAWASWNFYGNGDLSMSDCISLTYHMDKIQILNTKTPVFVTLNPQGEVDKSKIYRTFSFSHPLYTPSIYKAQKELPSLQGKGSVYFCGSYFGYGFHEDGLTSGLNVAKLLGSNPPWEKE